MIRTFFLLLICLFIWGCTPSVESSTERELTISAAASMSDSLLEIRDLFSEEYPDIQVSFNFGGAGSLRKQIEQGAPIHLFFSAAKTDYDKLVEQEVIKTGTAIFKNELVFIKWKESDVTDFNDYLDQDTLLAIGTPGAVPAGTYGKEVLQTLNVWETLEEQMVFTKDVNQVVTYVREGATDVGIVYASDVKNMRDVVVLETFDQNLHSPIEYYLGKIENEDTDTSVLEARDLFYQFSLSDVAQGIFKKYGFDIEK